MGGGDKRKGRECRSNGEGKSANVVEHGLHQRNRHFGLLDQVILGVLDLQASSLLLGRRSGLETEAIGRQHQYRKSWIVASLARRKTSAATYICFAESSSRRLVRTAARAFMATSTEFVRVFLHGARKLVWIVLS
jgi:hypothetical protein